MKLRRDSTILIFVREYFLYLDNNKFKKTNHMKLEPTDLCLRQMKKR